MRKLLIRVWIGELPSWYDQWLKHVERLKQYGFEFLVVNDYEAFRDRCREKLMIDINVTPGTRKAGDFDPTYGVLFADELQGYDFWGHCALDAVYGRLDRFVSDEFLSDCDIFGNDPNAINGCFSLYRNCDLVNNLFKERNDWAEILEDNKMYGFDEIEFNRVVQQAAAKGRIRFKSAFWMSNDTQTGHNPTPQLGLLQDGSLWDRAKQQETMMFHFHRYRQWPIF